MTAPEPDPDAIGDKRLELLFACAPTAGAREALAALTTRA